MRGPGWYFSLALVFVLSGPASADGDWTPLGSGTNNPVTVQTYYDGYLAVGGGFTLAGGVSANYVALWDGTWHALGVGIGGNGVEALATLDGDLYVGGRFSQAGSASVMNIAKWDGSSWSPVGDGVGSALYGISAMVEYGGQLVVGGGFHEAGGVTANHIAQWNGSAWHAFGGGADGSVDLLIVDGDDLIAAGTFTSAGGVAANGIARWDGTRWHPLGTGVQGIYAMTVYDGKLIVGGNFLSAGGVAAQYIAQWNGSAWSQVGEGLSSLVYALTAFEGDLIVGGIFEEVLPGGVGTVRCIIGWDGSEWFPLGVGLDYAGDVYSLVAYHRSLIAGGHFTYAGGVPVGNIAAWTYRGACCFEDGSCTLVDAADCDAMGGAYSGDGTVCDPNGCMALIGACCGPSGECMITTEAECYSEWLGPDFTCDPNPCQLQSIDTAFGGAVSRPLRVSSPSVGQVRIQYRLPAPSAVKLDILDLNGRVVRRLVDSARPRGIALSRGMRGAMPASSCTAASTSRGLPPRTGRARRRSF